MHLDLSEFRAMPAITALIALLFLMLSSPRLDADSSGVSSTPTPMSTPSLTPQ